jgi:hypothetical protein
MSCVRTIKYILNCGSSSEEAPALTFSNINTTGVGTWSATSGTSIQFKGLASSGGTVTITNDAGTGTINLEANTTAITAAIPNATTAVFGKTRLSSDADAIAKTATDRTLTPSNLAALGATTTFVGLTRLATNIETGTGVSTTLAVTPAGLKGITDLLRTSTTFANDAAVTAAVPKFDGQLGVRLDNNQVYVSTGALAGEWTSPMVTMNVSNVTDAQTFLDIQGGNFTISDSGANDTALEISNGAKLYVNQGKLDFATTSRVQLAGVNITGSSVITTSSTAGQVSSKLIADFISTSSTTGDYVVDGYTELRSYDTATVTLPELARALATLIEDLSNVKRPQLT